MGGDSVPCPVSQVQPEEAPDSDALLGLAQSWQCRTSGPRAKAPPLAIDRGLGNQIDAHFFVPSSFTKRNASTHQLHARSQESGKVLGPHSHTSASVDSDVSQMISSGLRDPQRARVTGSNRDSPSTSTQINHYLIVQVPVSSPSASDQPCLRAAAPQPHCSTRAARPSRPVGRGPRSVICCAGTRSTKSPHATLHGWPMPERAQASMGNSKRTSLPVSFL